MASTELSASLLRRGPKMYPEALKWLSIAADVAGTQVTEQRNSVRKQAVCTRRQNLAHRVHWTHVKTSVLRYRAAN